MENYYIDLHVHTNYSREKIANLSVKDTLDYYQEIGERNGKRIIIRINDHDTIFGGIAAVEEYINNKEKYPNIFVIPGMECNVSLNQAVKVENPTATINPQYPNDDSKYLYAFKKAHIGVAPILKDKESYKKWKNHVGLRVYSRLKKMTVDLRDGKGIYRIADQTKPIDFSNDQTKKIEDFTNLGDKIIACKNVMRKKLGVIIPFEALKPCIEDGLTHNEIVNRFKECCVNHLKTLAKYAEWDNEKLLGFVQSFSSNFFKVDSVENKMSQTIKQINDSLSIKLSYEKFAYLLQENFPMTQLRIKFRASLLNAIQQENYPTYFKDYVIKAKVDSALSKYMQWSNYYFDEGGNKRINIDELSRMVYEAGGVMDFEHPNQNFRIHKDAVVPCSLLKTVDYSTLKYEEKNRVLNILSSKDSNELIRLEYLLGGNCRADHTGLVRAQIVANAMRQNPEFKFNKDYLGVEIAKSVLFNPASLQKVISSAEKGRLLVSVGYDKHMNIVDKYKQYTRKCESFVDENGKLITPTEKLTKDLYNVLLNGMSLHEYEYYNIDEDKVFDGYSYDNNTGTKDKFKVKMDHVIQTAYCDAILGKDVNFANSSMFTLKTGAVIPEKIEELDPKTKMLAKSMANVFIESYNYSKKKGIAEKDDYKLYMDGIQEEVRNKMIGFKNANEAINLEKLNNFEQELIKYSNTRIDDLATQFEENEIFKQ